MEKRFVLAAVAVALAACTVTIEDEPQEAAAPSTDYPALMEAARIPGLTVAVIEDGQVTRSELFGVANADTGEAITAHTLFEAASLSKPVFATAVLRMAERGEFDLDQPLLELLPNERIEHDPRAEQLTARLVLSHQTGLPNWGPPQLRLPREGDDRGDRAQSGRLCATRGLRAARYDAESLRVDGGR